MTERLTTAQMLDTVRRLERLPYDDKDTAAIHRASSVIVPRLSAKYPPAEGLCNMVSDALRMEFVVVKSFRKRGLLGGVKARYTVLMGFDDGAHWEEGPVVNSAQAVAYVFKSMEKVDRWMDEKYGRKR